MLYDSKRLTLAMLALLAISLRPDLAIANSRQSGPAVTGAIVEHTLIHKRLTALGSLRANQSVDIAARISGQIARLFIEDGLFVEEGSPLVQLDDREQKAKVAEARVALADGERQLAYMQTLFERQAVSKDELEAQQAQVEKLKAALSVQETSLSYHTLYAPFDGILGFSDFSTGALVNTSEIITTLDDLRTMKLYFELPENTLSSVPPGTEIIASTDAWPDDVFAGTIDTINPRINPNNLTFTARAMIENTEGKLRPGMMVRIDVQQAPEAALTVPSRSVMFDGNNQYVFVIDDQNIARKQYIQTGTILESMMAIVDGLNPGDHIIDQGVVKARDGSPVNVLEADVADGQDQPLMIEDEQEEAHS